MEFEWDEKKNRQNLRKHGLDLADARRAFEGPLLVRLDTREDYGEDRWVGIGLVQGRVVALVFAEPRPDTVRVISMRKATRTERLLYEREIAQRLWRKEEN